MNRLYKSLIRPLMEYGDALWDGCTDGESDLLEFVQYEAAKIVTGAMKGTSRRSFMHEIGWEDLKVRRPIHKLTFILKLLTISHQIRSYCHVKCLRELNISLGRVRIILYFQCVRSVSKNRFFLPPL